MLGAWACSGLSLSFCFHKFYFRIHCWDWFCPVCIRLLESCWARGFIFHIYWLLLTSQCIWVWVPDIVILGRSGSVTKWRGDGLYQWGKIPENPRCIASDSNEVYLWTGQASGSLSLWFSNTADHVRLCLLSTTCTGCLLSLFSILLSQFQTNSSLFDLFL